MKDIRKNFLPSHDFVVSKSGNPLATTAIDIAIGSVGFMPINGATAIYVDAPIIVCEGISMIVVFLAFVRVA